MRSRQPENKAVFCLWISCSTLTAQLWNRLSVAAGLPMTADHAGEPLAGAGEGRVVGEVLQLAGVVIQVVEERAASGTVPLGVTETLIADGDAVGGAPLGPDGVGGMIPGGGRVGQQGSQATALDAFGYGEAGEVGQCPVDVDRLNHPLRGTAVAGGLWCGDDRGTRAPISNSEPALDHRPFSPR